jgi:hypothetical protein
MCCVLNTKVFINFMIWVLTKFQPHWTIVVRVIGKTLYLGLLKNSQNREARTEFFDHLNHRFSFWVEYQICISLNCLFITKRWAILDEQTGSYEFSCNEQYSIHVVFMIFQILPISALILLNLGSIMDHFDNEKLPHFRWLERHVVTLMALGTRVLSDRKRRSCRPT